MTFTQAADRAKPWTRGLARVALSALLSSVSAEGALAQTPVPGQSINMVSGKTLPGGDPFLQRQNEPSLAVSSRNPRHLLAGANDYRTVDIPGLPDGGETGDSWLGLFKSFDGGETWQSTLLPGYPQDASPEGLASPLKGYTAAADPIVRAGTHGLFYYGGIAFNRSTNLGVLQVTSFLDLNNKENGDVALARDPIRFAGTVIVDSGTSGQFLDKPWLGADVPRAGAQSRTFNLGGELQTVPCGNLYLAWAKFTGSHSTKIMLARSRTCGLTWENPTKVSESSSINQGTVVSVGPDGAVYVAWRRFAAGSDGDAILFARSTDFGNTFTKAAVVTPAGGGTFLPFDQASDPAQSPYQTAFRTNSYPTLGASAPGRVHLAWAQRPAPGGFARVVMATSTDGGNTWSSPAAVDDGALADDAGGAFDRGHQFMPSLAASAGRLQLLYYDTRLDHTVGRHEPTLDYPDLEGRFYLETRAPVGEWAPPGQLEPDAVFTPRVDDAGLIQRRHTIDVRLGQLDLCAGSPAFTTAKVSRPPFGIADFLAGQLQQLKFNPPNLPLFGLGRIPFVGDYIDIAGSDFVAGPNGTWSFNTACGGAPAFHAAWTSNEDVRPPSDGNWTNYTPVGRPGCDPDRVGLRNQNIYSSRVTQGLLVSSPQNAKRLKAFDGSSASVRAFVVLVQNLTDTQRRFRLHIADQPAGGKASFIKWNLDGPAVPDLEVEIPPRSGISRPVFAASTDPLATMRVEVDETSGGGLSGFLVLNADATTAALADPDGGPTGVNTVEIYTPSVSNPSVYNPSVYNPSVSNPSVSNPSVYNPSVYNPSVYNPSVYNPSVSNPSVSNATEANPSVLNPSVYNGALVNTPISDTSYAVTNTGNTAASYRIQLVGDPAAVPGPLQLLVSKNQLSPGSDGCQLVESARSTVLVNLANPTVVSPSTGLGPALEDASASNATFSLRPGETGHVTLRGQYSLAQMQGIGSAVAPAVIAHPSDPAHPEYSAPLAITNGSALPGASFGVPYSASLAAFGGQPPYSFGSTGSLPPGLVLGTSGVIEGTPSTTGAYTFLATVTDQTGTTVSRSLSLTVAKTGTSLTVALSPPAGSVVGQPVTATVVVTHQGSGSPTGSVTVGDGGRSCGIPAPGGSCTLVFTAPGPRSVAASYPGDANYLDSSAAASYTVARATSATTLVSSANPSALSQAVTLTASVSVLAPGVDSPTGTVSFSDGAIPLGAVPLGAGAVAALTTSSLGVGTHSITATYSGDLNLLGSTSAPLGQVVDRVGTITALASSANPSASGQAVTFTASLSVTTPGAGTPTGSVTFRDGSTVLGSATLSGSSAAFTTSALGAGSHSVTAQYGGDAGFGGSTSVGLVQTVQAGYTFAGFLTPLRPAGTLGSPSYSGTQSFGSAVPIKWQLQDASGNFVGDLGTAVWLRAYANGSAQCKGAPPAGAAFTLLYSPTTGAKGNSTFRFGSNQYTFNWDTGSTVLKGCYTVALQISDGSAVKATNVLLR